MKNFVRKVGLEIVNFFCRNRLIFFLAKKFHFFDAVFLMYPANTQFADYFTFRWRQRLIKWSPFIVGVIRHPSRKRSLMFAISSFVDKGNESDPDALRLLHDRIMYVMSAVGAKSVHFAGTLPSRFTALRVRRGDNQKNERLATASHVIKAIHRLRKEFEHGQNNSVIILGSRGYIGKNVTDDLVRQGIPVVGIDRGDSVPSFLSDPNKVCLIVNITAPEEINEYIDSLSEGTVILNEVYPSPHEDVITQIKSRGAKIFHIAGVKAEAFPSFPLSYSVAVPCCAALLGEEYAIELLQL
jgi:hypothetical protein